MDQKSKCELAQTPNEPVQDAASFGRRAEVVQIGDDFHQRLDHGCLSLSVDYASTTTGIVTAFEEASEGRRWLLICWSRGVAPARIQEVHPVTHDAIRSAVKRCLFSPDGRRPYLVKCPGDAEFSVEDLKPTPVAWRSLPKRQPPAPVNSWESICMGPVCSVGSRPLELPERNKCRKRSQ